MNNVIDKIDSFQIEKDEFSLGYVYESVSKGISLAHRVSMAALPVMLYFTPTFYPAWIALSTINTIDSVKKLYTVIEAKWSGKQIEGKDVGAKEIAYHVFEVSACVTVLALSIILFPVGLLISSAVGIIEDLINISYYTVCDFDPEKLALSCVKLVAHTATLAAVVFASPHLAIIGGGIGLGIVMYSIYKELNKDEPRALETLSFTAQTVLKAQSIMEKISLLMAERRR